eukprot:COSAG02_NODE_3567_length_6548_cov_23.648007_3_plen_752_part_00
MLDDATALSVVLGLGGHPHDSAARLSKQLQDGIRAGHSACLRTVTRIAGDSLRSNRWVASQPAVVGELVRLAQRLADKWQVARGAADAMVVLATTKEGRAALRLQGASQVLLRLVVAGTCEPGYGSSSGSSSEDSGCSESENDEADGQSSIYWRPPSVWSDCIDTLNRLQLEQHSAHAAASLTGCITVGERERLAKCHQLIRCPTRRHRVAILLALLAAETTASEQSRSSSPDEASVSSSIAAASAMCSQAFWKDNWERAPCQGSLLAGGGRAIVNDLQRRFSFHSVNGIRAWLREGHPSVGPMSWCDMALLGGASLLQPCLWRHQEPGGVGPRALPMQCGEDYRMVRVAADSMEQELSDSDGADPFLIADRTMRGYASGYSLVVNSLQLRHDGCATLASALARHICDGPETGVVHVGVNLYATPPEAQGLVPHYDDHGVFVIQLEGQKRWTLWPGKCGATLPRLRDERSAPQLDAESALQYVLRPGHWLYIPRGWPHAAAAEGAVDSVASRPTVATGSVHLSLSVDIERPFDMAGALHIALRCFCSQRQCGGTAGTASSSAKRQRTANDFSATIDQAVLSTEYWLHAHIDLVAAAPQSVFLRRSAFFRRPGALGNGDEALAAAACFWADFADTLDGLAELAARYNAPGGPGSEDALLWLQLLCDDDIAADSCLRGDDFVLPPRNFTELCKAVDECQQLRREFLAWIQARPKCLSDASRWRMIVEAAEKVGARLRRGRLSLASALAVTRVP